MLHPNARHTSVARAAISLDCCHPSCSAPAQDLVQSPVPLCEQHIMGVYKATNKLLTAKNPERDEYALLPSEQQSMPGPCPSCGLCGYLAVTITDRVRCLNASCHYQAWIDEFEPVRRRLLFEAAADQDVIYYMKFRDRVKIGRTNNLQRRCREIVTVELVYGFELGDLQLERRRHRQFADIRAIGEWFKDTPRLRAHVNNVCNIAA